MLSFLSESCSLFFFSPFLYPVFERSFSSFLPSISLFWFQGRTSTCRSYGGRSNRMWCGSCSGFAAGSTASSPPSSASPVPHALIRLAASVTRPSRYPIVPSYFLICIICYNFGIRFRVTWQINWFDCFVLLAFLCRFWVVKKIAGIGLGVESNWWLTGTWSWNLWNNFISLREYLYCLGIIAGALKKMKHCVLLSSRDDLVAHTHCCKGWGWVGKVLYWMWFTPLKGKISLLVWVWYLGNRVKNN